MTEIAKVLMAPQGPDFSELVQGYWRMHDWDMTTQQHLAFLKQHLELGITTVDHAHLYGGAPSCEELFGNALKLEPSMREKIEIISKCGVGLPDQSDKHVKHYDSTPAVIEKSADTSLTRLGVDALDVLLVHRPDWLMDVDVIAETFAKLKDAGKVKHFGVSNFTASQFCLLQSRLDAPLVTNQVEINPINFDVISDGTLDCLHERKVRPMAWSCLVGGRIFSEQSAQAERLRSTLADIAEEVGAQSIDQVIYAWVMKLPSKPVVTVGSGNIERVATAVASLELTLNQEQWYRIWVASKGHDIP